jgi:XRE family transcriptional regulator, regulator of sulfur utilization
MVTGSRGGREPADDSVVAGAVHTLRRRRGLSIERLAAASGVSRSAISDIERGRTVPTVNVVGRLARALGVDVGTLVGDVPRSAVVVRRPADGPAPGSAESRPLAPASRGPGFLEVRIPAHSRYREGELHAGVVHNVLVAEGRLGVELGDDQYLLGPGDALQVRDAAPCTYVNWSADPALIYVVVAPAPPP